MSTSTLSSHSRTILIENGSEQQSHMQVHSQQSVNHSNSSQQQLQKLKRSLQMKKQQMIQLINRNQFSQRVCCFNNEAKKLIEANKIQEALIYLNQAEKILEYAASSGRNIERKPIVQVLHNQACSYQILWDLEKCSNYIEALIFNFNSELKLVVGSSINPSEIHMSSSKKSAGSQIKVETQKIEKKVDLAKYYLLYCAINSQLKNNQGALVAAKKASQIMKAVMQELLEIYQQQKQTNSSMIQTLPQFVYPMLQELTKISTSINVNKIDDLFLLVRHYIKVYNSKCVFYSLSSSKAMQSSLMNNVKDIYQKYKNFSIGNIMQLQPVGDISEQDENIQSKSKDCYQSINYEKLIQKLIVFSICQFTMATELRYIALGLTKNDKEKSHQLVEFKQSQTYHLLGVLIIAMYMPFDIIYMEHIISSYHGHYKTVLLSNGLDGTPQISQENLKRIKDTVVFERKENLSTSRNKQDDLKKCSTTNQSNSSLIVSFHEEDQEQDDSQYPTNKKSKQSSSKKNPSPKQHNHSFVQNDLSEAQKNMFDEYYYVKKNTEPDGLAYEENQSVIKKQPSMLKCVKSKSKRKNGTELKGKSKNSKMVKQNRNSKSRSKIRLDQTVQEKQNHFQPQKRQPRQSQFRSNPSSVFDSKPSTLFVPSSSQHPQESGLKLHSQRTSHGVYSPVTVPQIYSKITKISKSKQSRSKDSKKKQDKKSDNIRQQSEYFNNFGKKMDSNNKKGSQKKQGNKTLKEGKSPSRKKQIQSRRQDQIKTEYFNLHDLNRAKDHKVGNKKTTANDAQRKSVSKSKKQRLSSKSLSKALSPAGLTKKTTRLRTQVSKQKLSRKTQNFGSIFIKSTMQNNRHSVSSKKSQRITVHKLKDVESRLVTQELGNTMKAGHFNRYYL